MNLFRPSVDSIVKVFSVLVNQLDKYMEHAEKQQTKLNIKINTATAKHKTYQEEHVRAAKIKAKIQAILE